MSTLSRRNFLYAGGAAATAAAASAAVLASPAGHLIASPGHAAAAAAGTDTEVWEPEGDDQLVLYVSNTGSGEVTVLTDGHEVVFHDKQLVARVQSAAKKASV